MSQENVDIVRRAVEAYVAGDLEKALADADPEIIWNPAEEAATQALDAIRAYLGRWEGGWEELTTTPEEFVDAGDCVLVTVHFAGRGRDGIEIDARLYQVHTVSRGKIVRMDEFTEQAEALEAMGLAE
jgi:ketosteroid isomerase-like protein